MFFTSYATKYYTMNEQNKSHFPEQSEPLKVHGTHDDESKMKEKYLRDSGKIEDMPAQETPKMNSDSPASSETAGDTGSGEANKDAGDIDERDQDSGNRNH